MPKGGRGAGPWPLLRWLRHQGLCVRDGAGRALGFALISGEASELQVAPALLIAAHLGHLGRVICDGAYASTPWLRLIEAAGAQPVVRTNPAHRNPRPYDRTAYRRRHGIENLWARLKE